MKGNIRFVHDDGRNMSSQRQGRTYAFLKGGGKGGNFGAYLNPKIFGAYPKILGPILIFLGLEIPMSPLLHLATPAAALELGVWGAV